MQIRAVKGSSHCITPAKRREGRKERQARARRKRGRGTETGYLKDLKLKETEWKGRKEKYGSGAEERGGEENGGD